MTMQWTKQMEQNNVQQWQQHVHHRLHNSGAYVAIYTAGTGLVAKHKVTTTCI